MVGTTGVKVGNVDIQFGKDFDQAKANQLVQSLQQVVSAVNRLANQTSGTTPVTPTQQLLATQAGLGPYFTVEALEEGQVLLATSAVTAAFAFLKFGQLAGTDPNTFASPVNGDVITFIDGYWSAVPGTSGLGLDDPGADALVMWDVTANDGAGGLSWVTGGNGITLSTGAISVNTNQLIHGQLLGLLADDHPQYALVEYTPQLNTPNTFADLQTMLAGLVSGFDITLDGNLEQSGVEGVEQRIQNTDDILNEGTWRVHIEPGQEMHAAVNDPNADGTPGADGDTWLSIQRIAEIVDTVGVSANSFTFNGFDVLAAAPISGSKYLNVVAGGVTYQLLTGGAAGGSGSIQFNLSAGWNSSSGPISVANTVAQDLLIPYGCTLQKVYIATQGGTGTCTVTLSTAAFPGPPSSDITGGVPPSIVGGSSYANGALTGWSKIFAQDAMIRATITVSSGFTSVKIFLRFQ